MDEAYLNDDTKPIHINIDDVLTISDPGDPFYYEIHRLGLPDEVLYSTQGKNFIFTDFFKEEQAWINTTGKIFGLGERTGEFWLQPGTYTIWAKD